MKTINSFLESVKISFATAFASENVTVDFLDPQKTDIVVPGILIDISKINIGSDIGDERLPLELTLSALCILSSVEALASVAVKDFAALLISHLRNCNFNGGDQVSVPMDLQAVPAEFSPGNQGYVSWLVSWKQTLYLGENIWDETGFHAPKQVYFKWKGIDDDYYPVITE